MTYIWYAAYGSNLSLERFSCYLRGGRPEGGGYVYKGCRDGSDPRADVASVIDAELIFGGTSRTWGGGVAFVDCDQRSETMARLYLITLDQFSDVVAQENWLEPGSLAVPGDADLGDELSYGLVTALGELDGHAILTLTRRPGTEPAAPAPAYLRHVARGLVESHGLDAGDVAAYLAEKRGVREAMTEPELLSLLERKG